MTQLYLYMFFFILFFIMVYRKILNIYTELKKKKKRKDPDAGKDCRQEEKGTTEDETVGWYH